MIGASMTSWSGWTGCRPSRRLGTQKKGPATKARRSRPWPTRWSASRWGSTWPVRGRTRRGPRTSRRSCGRSTSTAGTQPNWRGRMSGRRRRMQGQSPVGQCLGQEEPRHHPTLPSCCQFLVKTLFQWWKLTHSAQLILLLWRNGGVSTWSSSSANSFSDKTKLPSVSRLNVYTSLTFVQDRLLVWG